MHKGAVIGTIVATVATGGLAYAVYDDVHRLDLAIDTELGSIGMTRRLLDGDVLDGRGDLSAYGPAIARGNAVVERLRANHPVGSILRADRIHVIAATYEAMKLNFEQHNH